MSPVYVVNGTVTLAGWVVVTAANEEEAMGQAKLTRPSDFEVDTETAEVEFNVMNDETLWPWEGDGSWNPAGGRVRTLSKAGALIAAEIDRLRRLD